MISWSVFRTEFHRKYFPNSVRNAKELELLQLKQGQLSVVEYTNKFEELYRFFRICQGALEDFEEWKCIKYEGGLWNDILSSVGPMEIRTFSELVNKSRVAEDCVRKAALDKDDHQTFVRRDWDRNFAPRGQEFKKSGSHWRNDKGKTVPIGELRTPIGRSHQAEGCDGSILIDSTKGNKAEKGSPANLSLRGYEIIDDIKEALERQCPEVVSCADILALAARDAIFFAGGPVYDIPKERKDGTRSKIEDTINLPSPNFNASDLIKMFGQHGFSAQEMVALSGAHTIGVARCSSFKNRLTKVDPNLNSEFANTLSRTCSAGDNAEQPFDETRDDFDNLYFDALVSGDGVLTSDQTLFTSPRTRNFVNSYAQNQALFFLDFQQAMVKMSLLDIKEGSKGQVRDNCHKIN
ncbi:peroxidase 47 [Arachis ipaensis]|uniref:peroxidase 47 n=1 Tax=Arachis ipaensis TaxID=130454 RepID=UPI0007AF210A|nr:peroxidase 47 [Arachis ipaensis]